MQISRRTLLGGMLAAGTLPLVAGCGGDDAQPPATTKGGRLRAGLVGSTNESLNPNTVEYSAADVARYAAIFDPLALLVGGETVLVLAESIEPNADATRWTIRLHEGVTFHDGKSMTSADAVHSLRRAATDSESTYREAFADIKAADITVLDQRTFEVPLARPRGDFVVGMIAGLGSAVLPEGITDFTKPAGTGPFILQTYEPGKTAVLTANPNYFRGAPLLDELEVVSITDPIARFNALQAGQIDFAKDLSFAAARVARGNPELQVILGGPGNSNALGVSMNIQFAPFDNPRVRQAFRLAADRKKIVDTALSGFGEIGNDIVGKGLPGYNADLPQRDYDPDQARSLLRDAGEISVSIRAADTSAGVLDGIQVYLEQLKAIGVNASLARESTETYYGDLDKNNNTPILALGYINRPIIKHIGTWVVSTALVNTQGWKRPAYDAQFNEALATADPAKRQEILDDLQRQLYDEGGDVVWGFVQGPDGARRGLRGVQYAESNPTFEKASLG